MTARHHNERALDSDSSSQCGPIPHTVRAERHAHQYPRPRCGRERFGRMPEAFAQQHPDTTPVLVTLCLPATLVPELTMLSIQFVEWREQRVGLCARGIVAVPTRAFDTIANDVEAVVHHDALMP